MSAPVAADVLRELGFEPRIFSSVRKAVLFFERYSAKKEAITFDPSRLAEPGNPRSQSEKDRDRATYDRLLLVFRALDPEVDQENLHFALRTTMDYLSGASGYSITFLAERHGIEDERAYVRYVEHATKILRGRLMARGMMLPAEFCGCGCGTEQAMEDR